MNKQKVLTKKEQREKDQLIEEIDGAVERLRKDLYNGEYYHERPADIGVYIESCGNVSVRTFYGNGGFMDVLHGEAICVYSFSTGELDENIDSCFKEDLSDVESERVDENYEDLEEVLIETRGEKEYNEQREMIIDAFLDEDDDYQNIDYDGAYEFVKEND